MANVYERNARPGKGLLMFWLLVMVLTVGFGAGVSPSFAADYKSRLADEAVKAALNNQPPNVITLLPTGKEWIDHLEKDLMSFWMTPVAIGSPEGNFPTFRANDGSVIDPRNPPPEFKAIPDTETWIKNKVTRQYARMMGRQVFAYCVAFHLTGNEKYLKLAKKGTDYLLNNMRDNNGVFYTWVENGRGYPEDPDNRISQDMSYALMGPAMYYYLTRDKNVLEHLLKAKNYIFNKYRFPDSGQLRWVIKDYTDPNDPNDRNYSSQKELVAQLDQINAYMLLTTGVLEGKNREEWLKDMVMLASAMRNEYFSEKNNLFWGCIAGPSCKQQLGEPHVDYGHTIKTLWMMFLMGRRFNQPQFVLFAEQHMPAVFQSAYDKGMATWREKPGRNGTDRIWWLHDELDQAAATLALMQPGKYTRYLASTYKFWLFDFVDPAGKEAWHGLSGPLPGNPMYLKAHLWKNAFHVTEHALIGFITSQALNNKPIDLFYAFTEKPKAVLIQPYLLQGDVSKIDVSELAGFDGMKKYKVSFRNIRP